MSSILDGMRDPVGDLMTGQATALVRAIDASYVRGAYRSFEFATFESYAGEATVLLASDHAAARDMGLAIAGLVAPTSGRLSVLGVELARAEGSRRLPALLKGRGRGRLAAGSVGVGYVSRAAEADVALTVEEAVRREMAPRGSSAAGDALDLLALVGLATAADRVVADLAPGERGRFSAALALGRSPRVAVVDLTDPFVAGVSVDDARGIVACLDRIALERGVAAIALTLEPRCAASARTAIALDMGAREALEKEAH